MTLGDLYPDVRLYSEVETIIMTRGRGGEWEGCMGGGGGRWEEAVGGHMGRVGGDGDGRGMIQFVAHLWVCPL